MTQKGRRSPSKEIYIYWPWEMPDQVRGVVVVTDVYAATSNIASMLVRQPKQLLIVNEDTIAAVLRQYPEALVVGEDLPQQLVQVNNLPSHVNHANVSEKMVVYKSANGTRVIELALQKGAQQVVAASFNNIQKIVSWLQAHPESLITILPSGDITRVDREVKEDLYCARAIESRLLHQPFDLQAQIRVVETCIRETYHAQAQDIQSVTKLNSYSVVPVCERVSGGVIRVVAATSRRTK